MSTFSAQYDKPDECVTTVKNTGRGVQVDFGFGELCTHRNILFYYWIYQLDASLISRRFAARTT